jgi:ribosomal protein L35AE/L33A
MDAFNWIMTGIGIFSGIAGAVCSVILPILFIGGFGYFIYKRNQQSASYRQAAQSWQSTSGMVLMSTVQSRRSGNSTHVFPVVAYQYDVNGKTYQGKTIKAGEQFLNVRLAGQAQATVERYPAGATVTVYYNPANPAESALER